MQSSSPAIAVVGVGAIGGTIAAAFGDAGHAVTLCVRTPFQKLTRELSGEISSYAHPLVTDPDNVEPVDWVFLCTKAHQSAAAKPWLDKLAGPDTRFAVLQNGVDHVQRIQPLLGSNAPVLPCVILLPASAPEPGQIKQARAGLLQVPAGSLASEFGSLFAGQDAIKVEPVEDFVSAAWKKLVLNASAGICALAIKPLATMSDPKAQELINGLVREIVAVGEAEGAVFPADYIEKFSQTFVGDIRSHWTSIAADRRDGKPMEWDVRNAVVGRTGRKHGIPTPLNDALSTLLSLC